MINKKITSILFIFVLMLTVVCSDTEEVSENKSIDTTEKKYNVVATTPMLGEFVKKVGQDNINLEVLMPPSVDPHTFKLSPQDVQKVSDADLLFYVGMKYKIFDYDFHLIHRHFYYINNHKKNTYLILTILFYHLQTISRDCL